MTEETFKERRLVLALAKEEHRVACNELTVHLDKAKEVFNEAKKEYVEAHSPYQEGEKVFFHTSRDVGTNGIVDYQDVELPCFIGEVLVLVYPHCISFEYKLNMQKKDETMSVYRLKHSSVTERRIKKIETNG